jgi:hypothetical protein
VSCPRAFLPLREHNFNRHTSTTSHLLLVCIVVSTGYEPFRFQRLSFTSDRSTSLFLVSRYRAGFYIFRTTDLRLLPLTTTSFASIFFRASERTLSSHRSYVERIRIDLTSIFSTSPRWISTGWPSRASGSSMARTI